MKKTLITLLACLMASMTYASDILIEGFEYGNHDMTTPIGWSSDDNSWLCGYLEKDPFRLPHSGNWYAFSDADDAWMFMPLYLIPNMKYRFGLWAVSDGDFQLEIWAGSAPHPDDMSLQLFTTAVGGGEYEKIAAYVETITESYDYIGVRAVATGEAKHLTIDDLVVDMVEQYTFEAEPVTGDTAVFPGTEATFRFVLHNTGYDQLSITVHPSDEFFTNISCSVNGVSGMTFATQPDETVEVTVHATLRPEIEPGTTAWLDIHMTIPCNCNTALVTFWVTPLDLTGLAEDAPASISVFPNPSSDIVTIKADDMLEATLSDLTGKTLGSIRAEGQMAQFDISDLKPGVYLISVRTRATSSFVKPILKQ